MLHLLTAILPFKQLKNIVDKRLKLRTGNLTEPCRVWRDRQQGITVGLVDCGDLTCELFAGWICSQRKIGTA